MPSVVFLCVANSARSQMAEGIARATAPAGWSIYSAGSRPSTVNVFARDVMQEIGIDMSAHRSKGLADVPIGEADWVITLCAEEECPVVATDAQRLAWPMPDPAAAPVGAEADRFREVRDDIGRKILDFWPDDRAAR